MRAAERQAAGEPAPADDELAEALAALVAARAAALGPAPAATAAAAGPGAPTRRHGVDHGDRPLSQLPAPVPLRPRGSDSAAPGSLARGRHRGPRGPRGVLSPRRAPPVSPPTCWRGSRSSFAGRASRTRHRPGMRWRSRGSGSRHSWSARGAAASRPSPSSGRSPCRSVRIASTGASTASTGCRRAASDWSTTRPACHRPAGGDEAGRMVMRLYLAGAREAWQVEPRVATLEYVLEGENRRENPDGERDRRSRGPRPRHA